MVQVIGHKCSDACPKRFRMDISVKLKWYLMAPKMKNGLVHILYPFGTLVWERSRCSEPLRPVRMYVSSVCKSRYDSNMIFFPDQIAARAAGRKLCRRCWQV